VVGAMAGCSIHVPFEGWGSEGVALGQHGLVEWAVLDAQWFGLAQRRRRVFAVLDTGAWASRAPILLERDSLRGDTAPSRQAGQSAAPTLAARTRGGGGLGTDFDCDGGLIAGTVSSKWSKGSGGPAGDECQNLVAHTLRGDGFDASEDGTGRGTPLVPVAFDCKFSGQDAGEIAPTLRAMGHADSHQNAGGQVAVAYGFQPRIARNGRGDMGEIVSALNAQSGETGKGDAAPCVATATAVRRLLPEECEALQGFPRGYTRIPWRGKPADQCPDGPRYRALGNSMAVPCMSWLGRRIMEVEAVCLSAKAAA